MQLDILDVFAEAPLRGNQLAVVRGATDLTSEQMQAMALEMNYSETTFVVEESASRARVRIFTPTQELPFAGHPTIGTAWLLAAGRERFVLELAEGDVAVEFEAGIGWMTPPPVELREIHPPEVVARWLGLTPSMLDAAFPAQHGDVGLDFFCVGLESLAILGNLQPTSPTLESLPGHGLFAFTSKTDGLECDFRARMFFDAGGVREDPATGSANSIFAAYLRQLRGPDFSVVVDQGVEMGRPSRIYLEVVDGAIRVGGKVQSVVTGEWTL